MIGEHLGKYEVQEEVGQGGMSVVYRGRDMVLQRPVAIKVLHAHLSRRPESRQRFEREAIAIARLSHPNIVQIFDFSDAGSDQSYIVTEFIDGLTLRDFLEAHPLEHPELAAIIGVQLCEALAHAHQLGIIHRDIKPENVMICRDGTLKLMDFGIAQVIDNNAMTVTGTLLGSPAHMSPEMIEGKPLDFRADIFSMGTLLYFAACGDLPFQGRNPPLVLKAILDGNYLDAEMVNPRVGRAFARLLDRCMAQDPNERFQTVEELANRLRDFLAEGDIADPARWWDDFFHHPDPTRARLRDHLIAHLERRGRAALKARRVAQALADFNRVLAMDPEHERVLKLIRGLDRRRKVLVYLGAAAMILVTAAAGLWISSLAPFDDPQPPPAAPDLAMSAQSARTEARSLAQPINIEAERLATHIAAQTRAQRQERFAEASARVNRATFFALRDARAQAELLAAERARDPKNKPPKTIDAPPNTPPPVEPPVEPPAQATPEEVLVRLTFFPADAWLSIANRRYSAAEARSGIRLPAKNLPYVLQHEAFRSKNGRMDLSAAQGSVEQRLVMDALKPAFLTVSCEDDPNASVVVFDDQRRQLIAGRVNRPFPIPIADPISREMKIRVQITSSFKDVKPRDNNLTLRAGRREEIRVSMRP
jgi:serine/threonine protein kinase